MFPTHYLEHRHNDEWHRIGWIASNQLSLVDLIEHAEHLSRSSGDAISYRIVYTDMVDGSTKVVATLGPYVPRHRRQVAEVSA